MSPAFTSVARLAVNGSPSPFRTFSSRGALPRETALSLSTSVREERSLVSVMPLTAITRQVSPGINQCELSFHTREPIDLAKAIAQHDAYQRCLVELGLHVITLPAEPELLVLPGR